MRARVGSRPRRSGARSARAARHFNKKSLEEALSLSLFDVSVPVFRQYLGGLANVLAKAEAHCASGGANEADWLGLPAL